MPFTLAHPAAVLPLIHSRWFAPSALVIGSCIPDLPYFVPLGIQSHSTHTAFGLLWFCLPAGLVVYVLYWRFLREPILSLIPNRIRARISNDSVPHPGIAIVMSVFVGAATHTIWDSFTHDPGFVVSRVDILRVPLFEIGGYTLYMYKVLQHVSSTIGLAAVLVWITLWFARSRGLNPSIQKVPQRVRFVGFALVGGLPLAAFLLKAAGNYEVGPWLLSIRALISEGVFAAGSAGLFGLAAYSAIYWIYESRPRGD